MKFRSTLFILFLCLGLTFSVVPESFAETVWQIAPSRSKIAFKVRHLVFLEVEGRFKQFQGQVVADQMNLANSKMRMSIDVDSIYTGIDDRDKHLISADFFDSKKFPEITFTSQSVEELKDGSGNYKIVGELTMRGVTRPIELIAERKKVKTLPNGKTRMDLVATGTVNRFDYQLEWNEVVETGKAIVGDIVDLNLKIALLN